MDGRRLGGTIAVLGTLACATVAASLSGGANAVPKQHQVAGLKLFVTGTLADADGGSLHGHKATADILAIDDRDGGSGIESIVVEVDGKPVTTDRSKCRGGCPGSARTRFTFEEKRFGPAAHEIAITATNGDGDGVKRTISLQKKLSVKGSGAPRPVPAFYMSAPSAEKLVRQAKAAAERVARKQDSGHTLLVLNFGAARLRGDTYGASLRDGPFYSNDQIKKALQAAADAYEESYERGSVTLVYANSNGHISKSKSGYKALNARTARKAGESQGNVVTELDLPAHMKSAVGGDIEPGFDSKPELSVELVKGAIDGSGGKAYHNFGTAPCTGKKCANGWLLRHLCAVNAGSSRYPLPEIYNVTPVDQSAIWKRVEEACGIKEFGGSSANLTAELSPRQSWLRLNKATDAELSEALVVWPE
jgi:hypothetical protein